MQWLLLSLLSLGLLGCHGKANTAPQEAGAPAQNETPTLPAAVTTPIGEPVGEPSTATIGADGGTLESPDSRLTLTIPAGALESDTEISIQPISGESPGGIGGGFRLGPDGTEFSKSVSLTFSYADEDLSGTVAEALGGAYQASDGSWQWLEPELDAGEKTVSVSTDHFSDYGLVKGFNLRPSRASVDLNDTLGLHVVYCFPASIPGADEELATLGGLDCDDPTAANGDDLAPLLKGVVKQWYVNGEVGGSATNGTIKGSAASASYKAPSKPPPGGKVSVSGRMSYSKGEGGSVLLVSEVTIGPRMFSRYEGTISATSAKVFSGQQTYTGVTATLQVSLVGDGGTRHGAAYGDGEGSAVTGEVSGIELDIADSLEPEHCTQAAPIAVPSSAGEASANVVFDFDNKVYSVSGALHVGGDFHCVYRSGINAGEPANDETGSLTILFGARGPYDSGTCPSGLRLTTQDQLPYDDVAHVLGDCTIITTFGVSDGRPSTTFDTSWDLKGVE
jgi:hypothetical protein